MYGKKEWNIAICSKWMDLEIIIMNEARQRKTNITLYHLEMESKKQYKWAYLQNRNRLMDIENKLMVTKGEKCGGGIN